MDFEGKTVCIHCRHVSTPITGLPWHAYKCKAKAAQRETVDFVTGTAVTPDVYCREINNGQCPHYEERL